MITLLVIDDDPIVRSRALRYLARPEVQLASAANGRLGLEQAMRLKPDVILCDVDMPEMDGFELLAALRADASFDQTLVLMLTAESSRDSMRLGMTLGADDYLTKPFTGEELVTAFEALMFKRGRLNLIVNAAVRAQAGDLRRGYEERLDRQPGLPHPKRHVSPALAEGEQVSGVTVLCCELRDFTDIAARLTADELVRLLTEFGDRVTSLMISAGSRHLCHVGSRLVGAFAGLCSSGRDGVAPLGALAVVDALAMAAKDFSTWCEAVFPERGLANMAVDFGLYEGDIYLPASDRASATALKGGDPSHLATSIDIRSCAGWTIRTLGGNLQRLDELEPGQAVDQPTLAIRPGLCAMERAGAGWEKTEPGLTGNALHLLAVNNALVTTYAVKDALEGKLASLKTHVFADGAPPLYLAGYRLLRQIGSGGTSSVYVAIRESDDRLLVVKVLEPVGELIAEQMARFTREYTLLSRIEHPHVIRIFNQGFSNDHAYIAMEYFENGDLRSRINGPMPPSTALAVALQVADALCAIHAKGIVHRDIKPENLMVRADGSVVLADFGIAKTVQAFSAGQSLLTQHGGLVGSPSYVSPEQIVGDELTPASDLYSLGVLLFELLTGQRPYQSQNLLSLLAMHTREATPLLPSTSASFQPIIDRLMAKRPAARFASAADALLALQGLYDASQTVEGDASNFPRDQTLLGARTT